MPRIARGDYQSFCQRLELREKRIGLVQEHQWFESLSVQIREHVEKACVGPAHRAVHALLDEKNALLRCPHGMYLTSKGPRAVATGTGSRFQTLMAIRYFGLRGSSSGSDPGLESQ